VKTARHSQPSTLNSPFKQTEVGAIPEDWDDLPLEQITKEDSPICYGIVQVGPYIPNGIPVLAIKNLNSDYVANIHLASVEVERSYTRSRIRPEDVLVSVKGTTGRVGIVPFGFHGNISRDLARLRLREGIVPRFVLHMLQSDLAQRRLATAVVGTTRMELSIAILKEVRIPLPPTKAEQEAIAEALSDADALIESLEQLIAKKRQIKQGAMQALLTGKKRLPGFETKPGYKQTEVGVLPEEWALDYIENLAHITTGGKNTQDRVEDGQYPFFVRSQTVERINTYSYDEEAVLTAGDGVGTGKVFHYIKGKFDVHQRVYRISDFTEHINGYFFYLYFSSNFYNRIKQMTAKSSVDSVRRDMIAKMLIPLPPTTVEQTAIATILSNMEAESAALEEKLTKARQIKQGMMHNLLTGKIRLVGATGRSPLQTHPKSR
jgi:type I restriction enzyme, S subunit